jgi:glyoxylase-like metal-dependent hydrolase (beta-lactamase superfamily II)
MSRISETDTYTIDAIELGPMENFIYILTDKKTKRAAVVDPAWDVPEIISLAKKLGVNITDILLTHSHNDHINGITQILEQYDAQLHLLKKEAQFWGQNLNLPTLHHGGDIIELGDTQIKVLHTPGHTPGSACYHINDHLITGDTMFVWGCGRCDLSGGDPEVLHDTLHKLATMPGSTITLPGHNYGDKTTATMAEQCDGNPFMHFEDKDKFVEYRMHLHDKTRHDPYSAIPRKT